MGYLTFHYNGDNNANNYLGLGFYGHDNKYKFYRDRTVFSNGLTVPSITLNGTDLATTLSGKSDTSHNHDSSYSAINHNHDSSYAALSHTHTASNITDFNTAIDLHKGNYVYGDESYYGITKNDSNATYVSKMIAKANGKGAMLQIWSGIVGRWLNSPIGGFVSMNLGSNGKAAVYLCQGFDGSLWTAAGSDSTDGLRSGDWTKVSMNGHSHAISDITNLQTSLDGKSDTSHNHDSDYSAINHNHDSAYAPYVHTHTTADLTNWATATENFAKINASNTFTANQTLNGNLNVSNNKQIYVGVGSSPVEESILCKYEGNLGKNKYIRIGCGDNQRTAIMAFGNNSSGNRYLYR